MSEHQQQMNNPHPRQQAQQQGTIMVSRPLPPTLMRINADNQDKRAVIIFWVVFFATIIVITIVSSFLPQPTFQVENLGQGKGTNLEGCANPVQFDNNSVLQCQLNTTNIPNNLIGALMLNLDRKNQFAVVFLKIYVEDNKQQPQEYETQIISTFYSVEEQKNSAGKYEYKYIQKTQYESKFKFYYKDSYSIYGDDGVTVLGYQAPIFVVRNFREESFVLIVKFQNAIKQYPNVDRIQPYILLVNPKFTEYSFAVRYLFFGASLIACILYIVRFCKIPEKQRILQQKMIVMLSVLLVFFNDPFYPITVLEPNKVSSYFSVFFVINFVVFLIFFWIVFLDRMLYEDGQKQTKLLNWKRLLYIIITYIVVLVLYTLIAIDHIQGLPIVPTQDLFSQKLVLLEVAVILCVLLGFCYIIVSYIRLCMRADTLLWRNQLFLFFSVFFIVMTISLFFINGFQINSFAGNRILLLFTTMNMYTFYMQYMYSISNEERQRVQRGQVQYQQQGLLQIRSDQDYVDLQFDDLPGNSLSNQNFDQKLKDKTNQLQKYNQSKTNDKEIQAVKADNDDDKVTDFFKQQNKQQKQQNQQQAIKYKNDVKPIKKGQQFDQFSLDD